jgi:hypothetical protein
MHGGSINLTLSIEQDRLRIRLLNQACQLPKPLMNQIPTLLVDQPSTSVPYDAQLRLGIAWHLLTQMNTQLAVERFDDNCTFDITLSAH